VSDFARMYHLKYRLLDDGVPAVMACRLERSRAVPIASAARPAVPRAGSGLPPRIRAHAAGLGT
jgi:hypothetical protein